MNSNSIAYILFLCVYNIYICYSLLFIKVFKMKKIDLFVYNKSNIEQRELDKKILKHYCLKNIRDTICFLILRLIYVNIYIYIFMHAC